MPIFDNCFLPNFGGLVLGCIEAEDNERCILQHLLTSPSRPKSQVLTACGTALNISPHLGSSPRVADAACRRRQRHSCLLRTAAERSNVVGGQAGQVLAGVRFRVTSNKPCRNYLETLGILQVFAHLVKLWQIPISEFRHKIWRIPA